jgi:sugar/nucleoside kinase (ribokinase family)
MSSYDVLVAGEYYCDLIFADIDAPPRLGDEVTARSLHVRPGGCYTMALGLTRLGVPTAWACDFGTDIFSRIVLDDATRDGIDPIAFRHLRRSAQMVSVAFADRTERGFVTYRESAVVPPDASVLVRTAPRWLLQTFRYTTEWLAFMSSARDAGARIFGDCSGDRATLDAPGVREFIGLCDVFSPNETETLVLTGESSIDAALDRLVGLCPAIVVKRGAAGATAIVDDIRYDVPAPNVTVVDTVGAGDAFAAGYLAATIRTASIEERLVTAVACGSLSTTAAGNSACPTVAQLNNFLTGAPERRLTETSI